MRATAAIHANLDRLELIGRAPLGTRHVLCDVDPALPWASLTSDPATPRFRANSVDCG